MKDNTTKSVNEAKFGRGDQVRIKDRPKYVLDKQLWGKSGYIKNTMGKDVMVTFSNGRTIMVDPRDLEVNPNESVVNERKPSKIVWDTKKISDAKRINVKKWYMKTYPTDELGGEIDKRISLWDVYEYLSQGRDAYKIIGVGDSLVRERIFEKLSKVLGVDYQTIYNMWESVINEGKFKVDDLVYNKRTKTVGIVRMGDDKYGEVKTDADGNVSVDELEKYNPIKYKHQTKAKVAPSTEREVSKRGLFNPFKNESVNEAGLPGEAVGYIQKQNGKKQVVKVFDTYRGGLMWQKKTGLKLINQPGIERVGVMNKAEWDKNHARYAESVVSEAESPKVITKKEWDKTHKDFKGMVDGKPYMVYLDKKTQATVYGPVTIKEDVVSEAIPLQLSTGQMKQLHNAYGKLSYDQMKKMMMRVVSRDKFIDSIKRFDKESLQKLVDMQPNTPFSKTIQAFIDGKLN